MARKKRRRVDVNLSELDNLLISAEKRPLIHEETNELRTAIHAMAELLDGRYRSSEKTSDVLGSGAGAGAGGEGAPGPSAGPKKMGGGHGRHGVESFPGATKVPVPHGSLTHKCECPDCGQGKLYPLKEPAALIRFQGQMPIQASVFELERLRCNRCGEVFTAEPPAGVGPEKYDESVAATVAMMKYGAGMPFKRLEKLQRQAGVLLPVSNQWDLVRDAAALLGPIHDQHIWQAAQGKVVGGDDTGVRIITLDREGAEHRTGVFTTGIVSQVDDHLVALYESGWKHTGENLDEVLKQRAAALAAPILMSDASSRNIPKQFSEGAEILIATCLAHGRRNFVDAAANFPDECRYVLEALGQVYAVDREAKLAQLSPEARLALHLRKSEPVMKQLRQWITTELATNRVEPNSCLGKAMKFMQNHWKGLTLFLRVADAPLDNNIVERALKRAILHRKNALYYRTENGAEVGDLFMSLIHTCELNHCSAFSYLQTLLQHSDLVKAEPSRWMPWNYEATLAELRPAPD